jgi:hypothetical protein
LGIYAKPACLLALHSLLKKDADRFSLFFFFYLTESRSAGCVSWQGVLATPYRGKKRCDASMCGIRLCVCTLCAVRAAAQINRAKRKTLGWCSSTVFPPKALHHVN